ncbi:hypothetical protein BDN72DRAFT_846267 [Pluteus cervinus]|uniref:Uncharacterized protein n=1 Tax=Pluteus cervinus TaxID=181527 RepID=A0ACD3AGK0_9AGAR|nr:hypothetical protein BDN72DRAFT_846267 [Pluteus cervinus]
MQRAFALRVALVLVLDHYHVYLNGQSKRRRNAPHSLSSHAFQSTFNQFSPLSTTPTNRPTVPHQLRLQLLLSTRHQLTSTSSTRHQFASTQPYPVSIGFGHPFVLSLYFYFHSTGYSKLMSTVDLGWTRVWVWV